MKVTVDRFEGGFAVVETEEGQTFDMPAALLPDKAVEGSVISITLDEAETEKRLKEIKEKMNSMIKNN